MKFVLDYFNPTNNLPDSFIFMRFHPFAKLNSREKLLETSTGLSALWKNKFPDFSRFSRGIFRKFPDFFCRGNYERRKWYKQNEYKNKGICNIYSYQGSQAQSTNFIYDWLFLLVFYDFFLDFRFFFRQIIIFL